MKSRTKSNVCKAEVAGMFSQGGFDGIENIHALGEGEYNAVFCGTKAGREYVVKIAPPADLPVMTLEQGLMAR